MKHTLKSFAVFFLSAAILTGVWIAARNAPAPSGAPVPFRAAMELNGRIWAALFSENRLSPTVTVAAGSVPRANGDIGLGENFDPAQWKLTVEKQGAPLSLALADLQSLPRADTSVLFKCIEGWSEPMSFSGVKFSDFMKYYGLGLRSGRAWGTERPPLEDFYPYVGLETPDGEYYVSIDMASMLHPQTLLAWEMNGAPLAPENGAPLRLSIPIKYGIKSLKRVGKIFFSETRPRDYWAEQGYDWHSGL